MIDLGPLGGRYSEGRAINDAGQVVGFSEDALGNRQMFLWDSALGMVALGPGYPWAINDAGQVVGSRSRGGDAFYWDSETGMIGLDELIPSSSGWKKLNFGFDINNRGHIVGEGITISGRYHAFLMTPVLPTIKVPMKFTPQTLNCYSKGKWVKANLVLPSKFTVEDVNSNSLTTVHPLGIEPNYTNVFVNENGLVELDAGFDRAYFCSILRDSLFSEEIITIRGSSTSGQYFYGMDTIKLIDNGFDCLAFLSSNWLESECGEPGWCQDADIDQDSEVNFKDFSFLASHWLEDNNP
jgi:probable HAF family extracellular repeat protein